MNFLALKFHNRKGNDCFTKMCKKSLHDNPPENRCDIDIKSFYSLQLNCIQKLGETCKQLSVAADLRNCIPLTKYRVKYRTHARPLNRVYHTEG